MLSTFGLHTVLPLPLHGNASARPPLNSARFRATAAATETPVKRGRGRPKKVVEPPESSATAVQQKTEENAAKLAIPLDNADNGTMPEGHPHEMELGSYDEGDNDGLEDKAELEPSMAATSRETTRKKQGPPAPLLQRALKPWEKLSAEQLLAEERSVQALVKQQLDVDPSAQAKWLARQNETNLHLHRDEAWQEMENLFMRYTDKGEEWQDFGGLGKGQLHWYSLRVNSEKSMKNVANFITQQVTELPPLKGNSTRDVREFEVWLPSKIIKAYNWRTEKMGNKTVKWQNGQEMLCRCVMDSSLYDLITANMYIGGFRFFQNFVDRNGIDHTLPEPCSEDYIAEVEAWTKLPEVRTKEEVMEEEFGDRKVTNPLAGESNRMDTRADIVEVFNDESGKKDSRTGKTQQLRRYKDDAYRGSFSNPSNWYDPEASKADSQAGDAPAGCQTPSNRRDASRRDAAPARTQRGAQRDLARSSSPAPAAPAANQTPATGTAPAQWQTVPSQQYPAQQQGTQSDYQSQLQQQYLPQQAQQYEPEQEQQQQQQPQSDYQSQLQQQYLPQQEQQYEQQYELPQQQRESQEQQQSQPQGQQQQQQPLQSDFQRQLQQQYLAQQEQQYEQWQSPGSNQSSDQRRQSTQQDTSSKSVAKLRQARQESSDPFDSGDSGEWLLSDAEEVNPLTAGSAKHSSPFDNGDDEDDWPEPAETAPMQGRSGTNTKATAPPHSGSQADSASAKLGTARPAFTNDTPSMSEDDYWNHFLPAEGTPESIGSAKRNNRSSSSSNRSSSNRSSSSDSSSEGWDRPDASKYGAGRSARTSAPAVRHRKQQQAAQQPQPDQWHQWQQPSLSKPQRPSNRVNNKHIKDRAQQYRAARSPTSKPVEKQRWTGSAAGSDHLNDEGVDDWAPGSRQQSWSDEPVPQSSSWNETNNDWSAWGSPARQEGRGQGRAQATGSSSPSIPSTAFSIAEDTSRTAATDDQSWSPASRLNPFGDGGQEDEWGRVAPPLPQQDAWSTDAFDFGDIAAPAPSQPQKASTEAKPSRGNGERTQYSGERPFEPQAPRDSQRSPRNTAGRSSRNEQTRSSGGPPRNAGSNWSPGTGRGSKQPRPNQGFYSPPPDQGVSDSFWDEF